MNTATSNITPVQSYQPDRITLEGDLGWCEAQELEHEFAAVVARRPRRFTVDLSQVTLLSSIAITQLLALHRGLEMHGGKLILVDPSPRVFDTLRRIRLTDVFNIRMTV
jgi:anti-anti-sigma factor